MKRTALAVAGLMVAGLFLAPDAASARGGFGGMRGGGFGGFHGGGFRGVSGFRGAAFRPGFGAVGFRGVGVRGVGVGRGFVGSGWGWRRPGLGIAAGAAAAGLIYSAASSYPYAGYDDGYGDYEGYGGYEGSGGYSYADPGCYPVPTVAWNGWGYQRVWVTSCY
jgi:hypothetical protein